MIIKQCNEGPFHSLVTDITEEEFNVLVDKLINDNSDIFSSLIAIYPGYKRDKIIDYYINKKDVETLLGFLDYCNDFSTKENQLNQKYVVDKLLETNDKEYVKSILGSKDIYFLTDNDEKKRLEEFITE